MSGVTLLLNMEVPVVEKKALSFDREVTERLLAKEGFLAKVLIERGL